MMMMMMQDNNNYYHYYTYLKIVRKTNIYRIFSIGSSADRHANYLHKKELGTKNNNNNNPPARLLAALPSFY